LNEYIVTDRPCIFSLQDKELSVEGVCESLAAMASAYGVSRNFATSETAGSIRFKPVLEALYEVQKPTTEDDSVGCVLSFVEELRRITGKTLLSAASKFLWMRFQYPIIIYDSLTWTHFVREGFLSDTRSSYGDFCFAWRTEFKSALTSIENACREVVPFKRFTLAADMDDDDLTALTSSLWFQERVYDHALVNTSPS
jgi:hypothetical protein